MSKVSGFTLIAGGLAIALYGLASGIETSDGAPAVQAGIVKTSGDDMRADRAVAVALPVLDARHCKRARLLGTGRRHHRAAHERAVGCAVSEGSLHPQGPR